MHRQVMSPYYNTQIAEFATLSPSSTTRPIPSIYRPRSRRGIGGTNDDTPVEILRRVRFSNITSDSARNESDIASTQAVGWGAPNYRTSIRPHLRYPGSSADWRLPRVVANPVQSTRLLKTDYTADSEAYRAESSLGTKKKVINRWPEIIQKRWNAETLYLNLDSLRDDEVVRKFDLIPLDKKLPVETARKIFRIVKDRFPSVTTISLNNNNLDETCLDNLRRHNLRSLINLSLQNNCISDLRGIEKLAGTNRTRRPLRLRELILIGNPVYNTACTAQKVEEYRRSVARLFPGLEVLDQEAIPHIAFDEIPQTQKPFADASQENPEAKTIPFRIEPSFVTGVDHALVVGFITRFLGAMDNDRDALKNVYDPAATFSISVNSSTPTSTNTVTMKHKASNLAEPPKMTRNLVNRRVPSTQGLHVGAHEVARALAAFTRTDHNIQNPGDRFCVDAFPVPHGEGIGLLMTLHGDFKDVNSGRRLSFDRTFMLGPASEGSSAQLNGWQVIILSDQFMIRRYTPPIQVNRIQESTVSESVHTAVNQLSISEKMPVDSDSDKTSQSQVSSMGEVERKQVEIIREQTKLSIKYAVECLEVNEWDLVKALAAFDRVKDKLPADAFA
ncbi:hypothetical protein D9613_008114 [Agrocybe pediades]|uniref:NTF2-like protein n=1 Tax=Agrocybe pediades TaxID=84607 RepID=A0A8H4QM36_9AGAR|nr:hypothetical protein D9613_008114 [Agrocybe pediades]